MTLPIFVMLNDINSYLKSVSYYSQALHILRHIKKYQKL